MSLNDRFSAYRKNAESTVGAMRQRMQQMNQQTSKNWRLIQQMENRPSVIAALKLKKRSLKQRLGQIPKTNVKARLSLGTVRGRMMGMNQRFRGGRGQQNLWGGRNRGGLHAFGGRTNRAQSANNNVLRGSQWSINNPSQLQGRLGNVRGKKQQQWKTRRGTNMNVAGIRGRDTRNRLGGRNFHQGRGSFRQQTRGKGQFRSNSYQQRGGGGAGGGKNQRGFGRGRGGRGRSRGSHQQPLPNKQTLDNELDEYMSRTKGNLDMELESYMAQAQAE